jgi:hypothetical protein
MSRLSFELTYVDGEKREFSNASQARKFLETEKEIWSPFLDEVVVGNSLVQKLNGLSLDYTWSLNVRNLGKPFDPVLKSLADSEENGTRWNLRQNHMPPPSDSLIGRLILGFFEEGKIQQAGDIYIYFFGTSSNRPRNPDLNAPIERASKYFAAAQVVESMPFAKVSAQKITGVKRSLEAQLAAVQEEVEKLQNLRAALAEEFSELKEEKSAEFAAEIEARNAEAHEMRENERDAFSKAEERFDLDRQRFLGAVYKATKEGEAQNERNQKEYERVKKLFFEDMKFKAPVRLWGLREETHRVASKKAFCTFLVLAAVTAVIAICVPVCFGNYIAESFIIAKDKFSAKGPLLVGGILTTMSILLWIIRLQYKVFLSERHLMLDAAEKKAFAQSYRSLRRDAEVSKDSEAVVLAALFRPTQDGIIKDDESGLDVSAAAILAKQFSRP